MKPLKCELCGAHEPGDVDEKTMGTKISTLCYVCGHHEITDKEEPDADHHAE